MSHHVVEFDAECSSCNGTGLYIGMAERSGAAIVCHDCGGAGCRRTRIEYDEFEGRRPAPSGVRRVYRCNPGIVVGIEGFGGLPLEDWQRGAQFLPGTEDRKHTCPAWFYQTADYRLKPDWKECLSSIGGTFSSCPSFRAKSQCWERWDREFAKKAEAP